MPTSAREKLQISDTSDCIGKVLKSPTNKRPRFSGGAFYDRVCKPGSVIDSHLSRRTVAGALQPPSRKQPGKPCFLCGVAPDRVYSNGRFHTPLGELLPRLSILTSSAQTSYPSPRRNRQVSVIPLRRLPPQNIRLRGTHFWASGGLFLLHFSSDRSGRALPVILALRSPDFPHARPFGAAPATVRPGRACIVLYLQEKVKWIAISFPCGYNTGRKF